MKLIKIGRAPGCNIQINNPSVSSLHAELLILDDGRLIIEDKNSTNGTFVGGQRLDPGVETEVRRGDLVQLGNVALNWAQVPQTTRTANYKRIINIGSNYRNDMVVSDPFVSRYHAVLKIAKDGKAYITDLGSRNGTIVNGIKIAPNKDIRIKRGDAISLGNKDITDELAPNLPSGNNVIKYIGIALAVAMIVAGIGFGAWKILHPAQKYQPWAPEEAEKAVVYVEAAYQLYATLENSPIQEEIWHEVITKYFPNQKYGGNGAFPEDAVRAYCATAFFVDHEGRMATNRHIASPWELEYLSTQEREELRTKMDKIVNDQQLPASVHSYEMLSAYSQRADVAPETSILWNMIMLQTNKKLAEGNLKGEKDFYEYINSLIRQIKKCTLKITGEMVSIKVGYPGRNYTHPDELARCNVIAVSPNNDMDIALLQLNDKKTPADITRVFDPKDFYTGKLEPAKETYVWIGYPRGVDWALDQTTKSLKPTIDETKITKVASKYSFQLNAETPGGTSGSPIYNPSTGQLIGVIFGHYIGSSTYSHACQAKYLKKMYYEELGLDADGNEEK
ncbi:MAG: FHA domain-containing protein [Pseudoflavonifractor sp.]|nr:FHA domain-containing protein [Alloprevotella sp.]MCM1116861.1 FHA domain-containing protein [Pseudoflavonifractor sp.]